MRSPKPHTREQARRALARTLIALRRRADGVSQETLANSAAVDRSYMPEIERGLSSPTVDILCRLLPVLGVSFEQFGAEFDKQLRSAAKTPKPTSSC